MMMMMVFEVHESTVIGELKSFSKIVGVFRLKFECRLKALDSFFFAERERERSRRVGLKRSSANPWKTSPPTRHR
jgi:hypothetical protein